MAEGPSWAEVNRKLQAVALERGHLAGYPLPFDDARLVVSPRFPFPELGKIQMRETDPVVDAGPEVRVVNSWWSFRRQAVVGVGEVIEDGRARRVAIEGPPASARRVNFLIASARIASAWEVHTELAALKKLATLVSAHAFRCYLTTGVFAETSNRSGVSYLFRRLRPTLALRSGADGELRVLAALCLHPIAYYAETHAGSMVPTDDVVAHLLLMRSDEPMFWRRSNQHAPWVPESGV